ncbi:MAG TPA: multicopper oxidase domain-containing protein [Thermoanaerobaculia bacterium]|nr:multicopper oxidase domain-containing protein [Thermoanaerobaculia bacterium]
MQETKTVKMTVAAVVAVLALTFLLPPAQAQTAPICAGQPLPTVGQITSNENKLQAVIKVVNGERTVPGSTSPQMLRYFEGYNPADPSQKWPVTPGAAGPGPTLRAEIGDIVQITLLNQVKVEDFAGTLDAGIEGRTTGCDESRKLNSDGTVSVQNFYPADDKYPNCFHASSSANLHFHGTHVTPSTTGDNVLITVRPNPKVTEEDVRESFQEIFKRCALGEEPQRWEDLPQAWRDDQRKLLKEYDETAPYIGPGRNPNGHGLPSDLQLWPKNETAIAHGLWPQYYSGSYPSCFQIPKYTEDNSGESNVRMGQSPGTHWYHSHKHGSTSLNLFNGLAGAFIITDNSPTGYDGKLQSFYGGKLEEKVLVIQQFTTVLNLMSANTGATGPPLAINGERVPAITMQPGQVQLWRMVNATVQGFVNAKFVTTGGAGIAFKQTAQDGVQLAWKSYSDPQNGKQAIELSPANRVDLLVQAPAEPGCYVLQDAVLGPILNVTVKGDPVSPAKGFPVAEGDYPIQPEFLADIDPSTVRLRREVTFGSQRAAAPPNGRSLRQFTIDGKQFVDQVINQVMLLDSAEEWTLYSTDNVNTANIVGHPFHIHINPFQIFEVFDPNTMTEPLKLSPPFVWWDTFAIPQGKEVVGENGEKVVIPGFFKMRSRFVDFTGQFVQHCHILAHEDRGMMQLLEVVNNKTVLTHH